LNPNRIQVEPEIKGSENLLETNRIYSEVYIG